MKKIRRGNDFVFAWEIERNGLPEDLSSVLEKHLYLSVLGKRVELVEGVDYDIIGNVIRIEVTPAIANILGTYKAEFHYILPDNGLIDEDRRCAVDVDAFVIVGSTAQADDPSEFTVTSDMAIAFKGDKGDKGDPLTYDDLTPEQKAELQQPATDAISSIQEVELAVETAEGLRVQAELNRQTNTSTAILNAEQATDDANNAAILANEKADLANNAAILANEKAGLAATATTEANTAAMAANTAAGLADTKIIEMDTLMSGYDSRVVNLETGKVDKQTFADIATVKIKNLIENGDFRNGATGWTGVQSVIDGWATCVSAGAGVYASVDRTTLEPFPANNILWASGTMRLNSGFDNTEEKTMIVRVGGISSPDNFAFITNNPKKQEYANGTLMPFSIVNNISNSRSARVFVGAYVVNTAVSISLKNLSLVNLTSTFGAGNEPTKEEMDALIDILGVQYFEGEITLTQKQIMNWQLKMIRQNRNAIIALGGTII